MKESFRVLLRRWSYQGHDGCTKMDSRTIVSCASTIISVVFVYIRCIYRTVELLEGWEGHLLKTEGYFIGLDGVCIAVAILIFCIFDPAVLLDNQEPITAEQSFNELNTVSTK
ncbi:hypothetical protein FPOA_02150 [Fusarium poae]|uniref:Uncharacterized protein n=1 Tax=Fusarium poae TaxID=36050 RepID=A0A1B8B664_FUSPO|nr:hypothetical protein FPOA_02150 [Fusarium poae]